METTSRPIRQARPIGRLAIDVPCSHLSLCVLRFSSASSLLAAPSPSPSSEESGKNKPGGSLVQRSLFQAWGIDRRPRREVGGAGAGASSALSGSWPGRKRRRGGEVEAAANRKPLACPFYKKIPGKDCSFPILLF